MAYSDVKLDVTLSVAQMACLARLFSECEVVKSSNTRELFSFLTEHFRSKRQENISMESLRVKYYNIEEPTREEVRKMLLRLLEKIGQPL